MAKGNGALHLNAMLYHYSEEFREEPLPPEWYQKEFRKLTKLTQLLKNVDLIDGLSLTTVLKTECLPSNHLPGTLLELHWIEISPHLRWRVENESHVDRRMGLAWACKEVGQLSILPNGFMVGASKLEVMKEGLSQVKDVLTPRSIGHKEVRHQESLVQKKLTKTLGHSSQCLFTVLFFYLYGHVRDIEVDVCGGVYRCGSENDLCLCMGRIVHLGFSSLYGKQQG
ncbi:hypothetical protein D8674_014994 [Pyrus ussuriensis x Pyrus communis]|uniref:Uncharacterized protein n=1 Tax=Pyrus ussuriensis x Pyrus communis TaxID=2448454 RepID=A0A5N5GU23_9ROSA|nr:hypothetical protein D8674_014994 [Pyrus ussuriensis x Pyrus communis]